MPENAKHAVDVVGENLDFFPVVRLHDALIFGNFIVSISLCVSTYLCAQKMDATKREQERERDIAHGW